MKIVSVTECVYGSTSYCTSTECPRGDEDGPDICYQENPEDLLGEYCPYLRKWDKEARLVQCNGELKSIRYLRRLKDE